MTYIQDVASAIRDLVPESLLPDGDTNALFLLYAVLALSKGTAVEARDVHDAWSAWMTLQGEDDHHESIVPYDELDAGVRRQDQPFVDAIREVAARDPRR